MSLHTRLSLLLTALAATLLLAIAGLWLKSTRAGIGEEIEAANRVAGQWLTALTRETQHHPSAASEARLLAQLEEIGRVRAHDIEVLDAGGHRRYHSPPSSYKAGRAAPGWFAALVEPEFAARQISAGKLNIVLHPDPSRATLDAWDQLLAMTGWGLALLILLFVAARRALDHSLRPLREIMSALDRTGPDRLDTRLPEYNDPELGRLSRAFNGMAGRLAAAVDHGLRLENDRELTRLLHHRLDHERKGIARELHDELAQGITAVRALAGAIAQRSSDNAALYSHAQSIVAVTGQMQDGIRHILQRLRPLDSVGGQGTEDTHALGELLYVHCQRWQQLHPQIVLHTEIELLAEPARKLSQTQALALLRITQEGLTNIARHANARQARLHLALTQAPQHGIRLVLHDDGRGLPNTDDPTKTDHGSTGSGLGLVGMRERALLCGGTLELSSSAQGTRLTVCLPLACEETCHE